MQPLAQSSDCLCVHASEGSGYHDAYHWHFSQPLCLSREPWRKNADYNSANESPPIHHWITSSARSSISCGMAMPSAFAVLRLITSSNFVGCSIGKSNGLAPLRILST